MANGVTMNVQMLTGHSALQHLSSEKFRARWNALYDSCPWATACQHPDFVLPWYALYGAAFLPVIVFDEGDDGTLDGLLTLALRPHGKTLTGAGDHQAEYQGWIQASGAASGFMTHALRALRAQFPGADLRLKYLPPGIPLDWAEEKEGAGGLCALRTHARPLMQIDAAGMSRQRNKKNHRQNYNRLKRLGEVQFESVVEHDHFLRMFDEISLQYDFRQAAFFRNMPFSRDPLKKPFHIELQKRGLLHTTVLTVGDKVAASHIGLFSKGRAIHLGINTYDPAFAAHSPGNLLLAMLGVHLVAEGVPVLDLTPGGDKYKEQFATGHDVVSELIAYPDRTSRLIGETLLGVVRVSEARLRAAGVRPADVVAAFQKMKDFRVFNAGGPGRKLRPGAGRHVCELRYRPGARPVAATRLPIVKNCLQDMVKFDAQGSFARYCDFLGTVMKRLERSNDLFTLVQDGTLAMACWARSATAEAGNHIVLFDLYVHPGFENTEIIRDFIEQLVLELRGTAHDTDIFYRGALSGALQAIFKQGGFTDAEGSAAPVGAGVLNCAEF
jgi:CelD/BcsL family acetyltransferase involved in cellulose biosynthesis